MIHFTGAGTGAADLITMRGKRYLEQADVIIYTGSLINQELLAYAKEGCALYDSSRMTLEEVISVMEDAEKGGNMTVRLHTGDPSIYGAVREQMDILDKKGIPYDSCPGVSACFGAAASLNLEYTLPGISQTLIITRMEGKTNVPKRESIESLAAHGASMAVYLSAGLLAGLEEKLMQGGYKADTPAAIVYKATWEEEETYLCTVSTIAETARAHGITKTALVLAGDAVAHSHYERSKLYSPDFETGFRNKNRQIEIEKQINRQVIKNIGIISFTQHGRVLSEKLKEKLNIKIEKVETFYRPSQGAVQWAQEQMEQRHALIFIGACGIAVRAIAPFVKDKLTDSPVLVMDEKGRHVIPILSGHIGGANQLAQMLAEWMGAEAVITTATDLNHAFAADLFAEENRLRIVNRDGIAKVSSRALAGETVTISIEPEAQELIQQMPDGLEQVPYPPIQNVDVLVSASAKNEDRKKALLVLKPREYYIGIGCKKGTKKEKIDIFIRENLSKLGIAVSDIAAVSSIIKKQTEAGICEWALEHRIPFLTYTAEELEAVKGAFHGSDFVKQTAGVDNVCERAACRACGPAGILVLEKQAADGMTVAAAKRVT